MRFACILAAVLAPALAAAEIEDPVMRLIGPEVQWAVGANLDRYRGTGLQAIYPAALGWFEWGPAMSPEAHVRQIYSTQGRGPRSEMTVIQGELDSPPFDWISTRAAYDVSMLNSALAVAGDRKAVAAAVDRWVAEAPVESPLAATLRQIHQSYDIWVLAAGPLQDLPELQENPTYRFARGLLKMVKQVRGGIRLGEVSQMRLEVEMQSPVEAIALAGIAPLLPTVLQLGQPTVEGKILAIVENFQARAVGSTVVLTGNLPDHKLHELARELREP